MMKTEHDIEISRHAAERLKSRLGLNKKAQIRHVQKVRELGEFEGKTHNLNDNIVYLGNRYIFDNHLLVTVMPGKSSFTDSGYVTPGENRVIQSTSKKQRKRA